MGHCLFQPACYRSAQAGLSVLLFASNAAAQWPGFGGPHRDFLAQRASVGAKWTGEAPDQLWERRLGDGYSGIAVDQNRLFTMYRVGDDEFVVSLDADTGTTAWEYKYASPPPEGVVDQFGHGPNATPLVDRNRVYTLGAYGHVQCFRKSNGDLLWSENVVERLGVKSAGFAYSASPIMYKDRILILLGSEGGEVAAGVLCFHYGTGTLLWARQKFEPVYASPIIITVDEQDQLIAVESTAIVGLNPLSGEIYWEYGFRNEQKTNCATPLWDPKSNTLFASSAYGMGSVALRLRRDAKGATQVEELWHNKKIQIHHGAAVLVGGYVYGSSGSFGPALVSAINLYTGEIAFRQRGFAKANVIYGDGKLILLDEGGMLAVGEATSSGFNPTAQAQVLEKTAWTAPTLVGNRLYLRDRKNIVALEVGPPLEEFRGRARRARESE